MWRKLNARKIAAVEFLKFMQRFKFMFKNILII